MASLRAALFLYFFDSYKTHLEIVKRFRDRWIGFVSCTRGNFKSQQSIGFVAVGIGTGPYVRPILSRHYYFYKP